MKKLDRRHQRGMTFIGLLCILVLVGIIGYAGVAAVARLPELHEARADHGIGRLGIQRRNGRSRRRAQIARPALGDRGHHRIDQKDIEITRDDSGLQLHAVYDDAVPYIANISLSVHFDKTVKVQ